MEADVRLHDQRREGNGSIDFPVVRFKGFCAVEHCPRIGEQVRLSESGYFIRYCAEHELAAHILFAPAVS